MVSGQSVVGQEWHHAMVKRLRFSSLTWCENQWPFECRLNMHFTLEVDWPDHWVMATCLGCLNGQIFNSVLDKYTSLCFVFSQVHGDWTGSEWYPSGNACHCYHAWSLSPSCGAQRHPFPAGPPQSREHRYPLHLHLKFCNFYFCFTS